MKMPAMHTYKIFISHAWEYDEDYNTLIDFLDRASNFKYSNYSVPKDKKFASLPPLEMQEELKQQIRPVEIVLVLAGMYVAHSDWIQFEIDFAHSLRKPILPIKPKGSQRYPNHLEFAESDAVGWQTDSIVQAIRTRTGHAG
ncbi:MAG: TIR domain-containing protein [Magnetococcus sp. MYC-9]